MEKNKENLDLENKTQEKQVSAYDVEMRKLDIREKKEKECKDFKEKNKHKIIALILGIVTIGSLFDYGFFRTLGIWIVLGFCYCLGGWLDKDPKVMSFVINLIKKFQ